MSARWVLWCPLSGFFKSMTGIGPACTQKVAEAAVFATRREAVASPAMAFALTSFQPMRKDKFCTECHKRPGKHKRKMVVDRFQVDEVFVCDKCLPKVDKNNRMFSN